MWRNWTINLNFVLFKSFSCHTYTLARSLTSINSDKRTIVKVDWRLSRRQRHTITICAIELARAFTHELTHTHTRLCCTRVRFHERNRSYTRFKNYTFKWTRVIWSVQQKEAKQSKTIRKEKQTQQQRQQRIASEKSHKFVAQNKNVFFEAIVNICISW